MSPRNARREASERIDHAYDTRVLEPSPPAVADDPWFADDPVARGEVAAGRQVVSPVATGHLRWDDLRAGDPALAEWCADRWLGAWRRLEAAPAGLAAARRSLHGLAEDVLKPARERVNGKIGLRYTYRGFGTPFFGEDRQVRVEGATLIFDGPDGERREALEVDPEAAGFIGDWFGFAASVLEELRAGAGAELAPSRVQLWPEHFDMAVELGDEAGGRRAGYGCSPGDEAHPEPYVYVVPWQAPPEGELWQARGFAGAELPLAELLAVADQRAAALDFLRLRLDALNG